MLFVLLGAILGLLISIASCLIFYLIYLMSYLICIFSTNTFYKGFNVVCLQLVIYPECSLAVPRKRRPFATLTSSILVLVTWRRTTNLINDPQYKQTLTERRSKLLQQQKTLKSAKKLIFSLLLTLSVVE